MAAGRRSANHRPGYERRKTCRPEPGLSIGSAVIEITEKPHTGCAKFAERFGNSALRFISTPTGNSLRLRGACARVVQSGDIRVGGLVTKVTK